MRQIAAGASLMLPDSNPQLGCDDHKPAAHCTECAADMGWKSCGTGRCLEMFCSGLKEREHRHS